MAVAARSPSIDRYRVRRPGTDNPKLGSAIQTDHVFRQPARRLADARAANGAPTWMYWFTWPSPAFGGAVGSCHALDIPFVFHNLHRAGVEMFTGDGDDRVPVADAYADALLGLARDGDPGWPQHDLATRPTMVFDVSSELQHDPEPELRELWMTAS
jgi:para-nitrobenzyl esterase